MKVKLTGILLVLCLVAPVSTTYFVLQFQKNQVKKEVKWKMIAGIDKEELALVKVAKQESETLLRWKHSKEFEFEGEMYDVVETKIIGDTIYHWCWWDHKETKLSKQLDNLLAYVLEQDPLQKKNKDQLSKFYKSLYFQLLSNESLFPIQLEQAAIFSRFNCLTLAYPPPLLPPEIV